ncbi:expressed unknown protein [Seminavis robusta]|uniref:Uncharacterized protein n=1 Tax=Seminavis robusta TaxID=568900 RepID=A0A9N8ERD4_9STRA|nr:expressed unknown protein [Seminavis robusta]|eukprot:Sro1398_g269281.1  (135) ;mRNA; f:21010-21414
MHSQCGSKIYTHPRGNLKSTAAAVGTVATKKSFHFVALPKDGINSRRHRNIQHSFSCPAVPPFLAVALDDGIKEGSIVWPLLLVGYKIVATPWIAESHHKAAICRQGIRCHWLSRSGTGLVDTATRLHRCVRFK